jgi:hypothetical protein
MPQTKLSTKARQEMVRRALRGENQSALGREYGLARQRVHEYARRAEAEVQWRLAAARDDLAHWEEVHEILRERAPGSGED